MRSAQQNALTDVAFCSGDACKRLRAIRNWGPHLEYMVKICIHKGVWGWIPDNFYICLGFKNYYRKSKLVIF